MKTLTLSYDMVELAEYQIGIHTINLHTNIVYKQTVITLCSVNVYNHGNYIL